ncbi:MAG: hypothetical protein MPEBLZ_00440 [Candidatus Methanoperedens nitroreducens]|uniref:Glycosyltransferase RgtA/B/C/D-like domain-containing protein n=1 Tax=Candidatus Methanoperedens nitratireducens TaxID=1392998 RepID=A0A0P8A9J9_9EURY|nr:DUF6541 family protein [Candidatus Methanoperedens sp. BLZ2]KPQ44969.1 MAG: hypothetical protein MPEBLZ_00440 [Candidatus Methanoperedens sp. BLZ1]MBZ0174892.1 hypothetical protein [Candidatus Methanoperedens nitroreducens]
MDTILALKLVISTIIVLFLPGYFLYNMFLKKLNMDFFQRLIISPGLSLSFIPLLTYFFTLIGMKLNTILILLIFLILAAIILLKYILEHRKNKENFFNFKKFKNSFEKYELLSYLILFAILLISLFVRLIPVKDMLVGPGSDSYHHTLIVQLIIENGGIPHSYEPYAQLSSFTYHFGFHTIVAFIYWVSGLDVAKLVLYTGQILNAFAILPIFLFADRLFKDRKMALISSFIVGLISVFPAYLINWGRFTSLTGMIILPIAFLLVIESIKLEKRDIKILILSGLILSGLFVTHYRIIIAALCFLLVYILYELYSNRTNLKIQKEIIFRCAVIGITAIILLIPWFIHLLNNSRILSEWVNTANYYSLERIGTAGSYYSNTLLLVLSLSGASVGILKRNKYIIIISIWVSILIAFSNPYWIKLPGSGRLDFVTVVTMLFFPVSVTCSYFIIYLSDKIKLTKSRCLIVLSIILLVLIPFSAIKMAGLFESESVFVKNGDIEAMTWIKSNTSKDAVFLIDSIDFDWNRDFIMGIDGGSWIPLLTGRKVIIPPMVFATETAYENNYTEKVKAIFKASESINSESSIQFFNENNVSYVYFGGKNWGKLKLQNLQNNPYLEPVYSKDGVWIFRIGRR